MRSIRLLAALALTLGLVACGGGDDDDGNNNGNIDAPTGTIDAPVSIDAAPYTGIGQACTGAGQGDCPTGFTCLTLEGAAGGWCSKTCVPPTQQNPNDTCPQGYTGPGIAACFLQVTPAGGGTAMNFCGVVCSDAAGGADYCPGCDGTCPGNLQCTAPLMGGNPPSTLANGCQ